MALRTRRPRKQSPARKRPRGEGPSICRRHFSLSAITGNMRIVELAPWIRQEGADDGDGWTIHRNRL